MFETLGSPHVGDKIEFVITEKNEVLLRPITKKVDDVFGLLHQAGKKPVSIEDMDAAIKQKIRESFLLWRWTPMF